MDIWHEMEVIQGIFNIGMPHIPHKIRGHGIHVFPPQPAVHVGMDKVMAETIRTNADAGSLLLRESGIPETGEVLFQPAGAVWAAFPVREKERMAREQAAGPAVVVRQISRKFFRNMDPPAPWPLGLEDIKIPSVQMHIFPGKRACPFAAEPAAVQEPEDCGEDQVPSLLNGVHPLPGRIP